MKDKKYRKVRDHCNYTGEYRGAAHSIRSFKFSITNKIFIFFHNESNYDYHWLSSFWSINHSNLCFIIAEEF